MNATDTYILDCRGEPRAEPDVDKWADWFSSGEKQVAVERVGESRVSTVFLGMDHNFILGPGHGPILWETMVFGGPLDHAQARCGGSREQAEAMHARMVESVKRKGGIVK